MILQMAWRNIWRNKMRSLVIAMSVAIGLLTGLSVLALSKGMMESRLQTVIYSEAAHLQVHHPDFKKDYDPEFTLDSTITWLDSIRSLPTVNAVAARSITQAMLSTPTGSAGVEVIGVIPDMENEVSQLDKKIQEGNGLGQKKNGILVGKKLVDKMKLKTGSKLVLTFTDTADNIVSAAFRVAGIYRTDNTRMDERNVYVKLSDLNELLGTGHSFHEIAILLKNDNDLESTEQELEQKFPGVLVESWKEISPDTEMRINTMDSYMYIIIGIIMLALAFGIINTMLMAILERTREIGMIVALGMNRLRLFLLILSETVFLTIIGTPAGLFLAWLISGYFEKHGIDTSSFAGRSLNNFGFSSTLYPVFPTEKIPDILLIVIITALVSCIFPALKAGRLRPVEALRK